MKKRLIGVLAFALAVSAGAAFVLYQLIASKITVGASTRPPTTKVLVAARDLELGALIQDRDVIPQDYLTVPAGAILKKEDIVGRGVISPVHQDAAFYEASLAPKGAGAGFASTIPQGMRAFAVHVNEVVGVAGFVTPGQRVDVLASGTPPNASQTAQLAAEGTQVRTILQNIEVKSAGVNIQKDAEGKPQQVQVVNLLVTPEQAEMLSLASSNNGVKIQLVLRNPLDTKTDPVQGSAMLNIFDQNAAPVKSTANQTVVSRVRRKPKPKPFSVVVMNGSKQSVEKFPALEENKQ